MDTLFFLDMPKVLFETKVKKCENNGKITINQHGFDDVEFYVATNVGEELSSMNKIASGGELSRIMLALKNAMSDKNGAGTVIFDEIDTGVSGRAAQKIGIKLQEISEHRQVLCVTHLPQMAVMADNHLLIKKETVDGRTVTDVIRLDDEGRAGEVARIMSGENPSELMMQNAREQLMLNKRKQNIKKETHRKTVCFLNNRKEKNDEKRVWSI